MYIRSCQPFSIVLINNYCKHFDSKNIHFTQMQISHSLGRVFFNTSFFLYTIKFIQYILFNIFYLDVFTSTNITLSFNILFVSTNSFFYFLFFFGGFKFKKKICSFCLRLKIFAYFVLWEEYEKKKEMIKSPFTLCKI